VVLIAGGSPKGADFAVLGKAIASGVAALITMGEEGSRIVQAAQGAGFTGAVRQDCQTMEAAVAAATAQAQKGGVVLLSPACASFGMFASYVARGEAFRHAVQG
jgi:UDP-N-acetylmuramoylalanine--D-glutamate ligase